MVLEEETMNSLHNIYTLVEENSKQYYFSDDIEKSSSCSNHCGSSCENYCSNDCVGSCSSECFSNCDDTCHSSCDLTE